MFFCCFLLENCWGGKGIGGGRDFASKDCSPPRSFLKYGKGLRFSLPSPFLITAILPGNQTYKLDILLVLKPLSLLFLWHSISQMQLPFLSISPLKFSSCISVIATCFCRMILQNHFPSTSLTASAFLLYPFTGSPASVTNISHLFTFKAFHNLSQTYLSSPIHKQDFKSFFTSPFVISCLINML